MNVSKKYQKNFKFGFATSLLQEDQFSSAFQINDDKSLKSISSWSDWFKSGINTELCKIWEEREENNFDKQIKDHFELALSEFDFQIEQAGLDLSEENNYENGFKQFYFQIDLHVINEALNDSHGPAFFKELGESIKTLFEKNTIPKIYINQFSLDILHDKYDENLIEEIIRNFKFRVGKHFLRIDEISIELLEKKSVEDYKKLIDIAITQGEKYGGLKIYRMSVEWAELNPEEGIFDESAAQKYIEIIKYVKSKGVEVMLCLNHMSWPVWIENGWMNDKVLDAHKTYVDWLLDIFEKNKVLNQIDKILIFNEPHTWIPQGFIDGRWPPHKSINFPFGIELTVLAFNTKYIRRFIIWSRLYKVFKNPLFLTFINTLKGQKETYEIIKNKNKNIELSISEIITGIEPEEPTLANKILAKAAEATTYSLFKVNRDFNRDDLYSMDFVAPQLYATFHINVNDYGYLRNSSVIANPDIENKQINGWIDDPAIYIVRTLEVANIIIENAIVKNINKLDDLRTISFTEFGNVTGVTSGITRAENILNNLSEIVGFLPTKVEYMVRWAPADNWEWDSGFAHWARFGDYNRDLTPKPEMKKYKNFIDWKDERILRAGRKLLNSMEKYSKGLEIDEDVEILDVKIVGLREFLS